MIKKRPVNKGLYFLSIKILVIEIPRFMYEIFHTTNFHQKIKLKDLEDFDDALLKSLQMVLDADDVKDLDLVFSIDDDQFWKITTIELIENGEKIEVTNENRMEYVS